MRKFLSRKDRKHRFTGTTHGNHSNKDLTHENSELESFQEDDSSIFGSSSRISRRTSILAERSFGFLKPDDSKSTIESHDSDSTFHKKNGLLHTISTKGSFRHHSQSDKDDKDDEFSIQKLVVPNWDSTIVKTGWLNLVDENSSELKLKLCRAVLKGSTLYVFKPQQTLARVLYFMYDEDVDDNIKDASNEDELNLQLAMQAKALAKNNGQFRSLTNLNSGSDGPSPQLSYNSLPSGNSSDVSLSAEDEASLKLKREIDAIVPVQTDMDDEMINSKRLFADVTEQLQNVSSKLSVTSEKEDLNEKFDKAKQQPLPPIHVHYVSPICPHPDLSFEDSNGVILGGSIESICHTIIFYPSQDVADKLIKILPMISRLEIPLEFFRQYLVVFTAPSTEDPSENLNHAALSISYESKQLMISRIILCLKTLLISFSGFVLVDSIFSRIWDILVILDGLCDTAEVKKLLRDRQTTLHTLLGFESDKKLSKTVKPLTADEFLSCPLSVLSTAISELDHRFINCWSARSDRSLALNAIHLNYSYWRKNILVFDSNSDLHYLAMMMDSQLFKDEKYKNDPAMRARLLEKWLMLGEMLYRKGNMASWLGIASFVCSVPILRLRQTWSHVNERAIEVVTKSWSPIIFEVRQRIFSRPKASRFRVLVPAGIGREYMKEDVVPYYGDIRFSNDDDTLSKDFVRTFCEFNQKAECSILKWDSFYRNLHNDERCVNAAKNHPNNRSDDYYADVGKQLESAISFRYNSAPFTMEAALKDSLEVEVPVDGHYYKYHDHSRSPLFLGSYPSILFPKLLNSYEIYDRESLLGAIGGMKMPQSIAKKNASKISDVVKSVNKQAHGNKFNRNTFLKHVRDVFNVDTFEFEEKDDSLIFKTVMEYAESDSVRSLSRSRPSSILFTENNSMKRFSSFSTSSFNLDEYIDLKQTRPPSKPRTRKGSEASSSSSINFRAEARNKLTHGQLSIPILTKAATIERLIDLLVLTSSIFSSRISEDQVKEYAKRSNSSSRLISLKMDQGTYTVTFFAMYRCFCSPYHLISGLMQRFIGAKSCSVSIYEQNVHSSNPRQEKVYFPNWNSEVPKSKQNEINWKYVAQIQLGVVESLLTLFEFYCQHFVGDMKTRNAIESLFENISLEINYEWPRVIHSMKMSGKEMDKVGEIELSLKELHSSFKKATQFYLKNCFAPITDVTGPEFTSKLSTIPSSKCLPKPDDNRAIMKLIFSIDQTISETMSHISVEDWVDTFEILEVVTAKSNISLFNYDSQLRDTPDELLLISNVYHWIATLIDPDGPKQAGKSYSYVIDQLPHSVQAIFHLYFRLKNYFASQVLDPCLSFKNRVKKMATLLKMLSISRVLMRDLELFKSDSSPEENFMSPHVPSMIESCIANMILSPESRLFSSDWSRASQKLESNRDPEATYKCLSDMLPDEDQVADTVLSGTHLTLSPGWILQCILEIACLIPNMYVKNTNLVNFDKDRFAYNCIINSMDMLPPFDQEPDIKSEFNFLLQLKAQPISMKVSYQVAEAEREKEQMPVLHNFSQHLEDQRKLMGLESSKRALLYRRNIKVNIRQPPPPSQTVVSHIPRIAIEGHQSDFISDTASVVSSAFSIGSGESRLSRFKFGGIFNRGPKGLYLSRSAKAAMYEKRPILVSQLPDVRIFLAERHVRTWFTLNLRDTTAFSAYVAPNSFKLDTGKDTNHERSFQATSADERDDWLRRINYVHRHWFFSHSLNKPGSSIPPKMVFGVPLEFVCVRDQAPIPKIIEKILSELEYRGLEEVGLYRRSASLSAVQKIKDKINVEGDFNMEDQLVFDVHNLTGCIKCYLRELPDPLICDSVLGEFSRLKDLSKDDKRFPIYQDIFQKLPVYSYNLLERISRHLRLVVEYQKYNKMTPSNLATILGGSLIEGCDPINYRKFFGLMTFVCEDLILNYDRIFSKQKVELQCKPQDDDVPTTIPTTN